MEEDLRERGEEIQRESRRSLFAGQQSCDDPSHRVLRHPSSLLRQIPWADDFTVSGLHSVPE
jgi:hypothetical protein